MELSQNVVRQEVEAFASEHVQIKNLQPLTADASFRSYWRVQTVNDQSFVIMDSPPSLEDSKPFVIKGRWLHKHGIPVPEIFQQDPTGRFLLLEDFGDISLGLRLSQDQSIRLLQKPIDVLLKLAKLERPDFIRPFNKKQFIEETELFDQWCLNKLDIGAKPGAFIGLYELLADAALDQPQCFVHRDFHSLNIHSCSWKPDGVGIIDFQDGLWGPATYDLGSLLQDRYISWPDAALYDVIESYRQMIKSRENDLEFRRQVMLVGLQRNIRILGVFHRLSMRDNKPDYLNYVPRKAFYCQRVLENYDELKPYAQDMIDCFRKAGWI